MRRPSKSRPSVRWRDSTATDSSRPSSHTSRSTRAAARETAPTPPDPPSRPPPRTNSDLLLRPLLVVDGPSVLYRAFFALPKTITDERDRPVNALLGAVNMTLQVVDEHDPRAVVFC